MKKLAIITTHPIQYYAPVFKQLAQECNLHVFYTWGEAAAGQKFDQDFKKEISWDIPLLDGYQHTFLKNKAKEPGSHHFFGIQNPDIIDKIHTFAPNAILVYGWAYKSHLQVIRHFSDKIPIWFRGDSTLLGDKSSWKKLIRKALLTWVYCHIDKAFYVGTANKAYFKAFGLEENQLIFAPHAVDNERFSEDRTNEANLLRQNFDIKDDEILILFAGKLEKKKSPELLLQAFNELKMDDVHLLFVGNGELEENLKQAANLINPPPACRTVGINSSRGEQNFSIKKRVHFMDFQNQSRMPAIYQACNLMCLPSKSETWGLVINEAMASGRAILVSNKVGCAQDVVDKSNGAIFNNIKELAQNLNELSKDRKRLVKMGLASKKHIASWTFQLQSDAILHQVKSLKNG